jgi:membrane-bound lytic murein transglycosylase D
VQSAVKRTGYADFWELYRRNVLPKETRNYVPIIVAVTIMAKNPDQYGLASVLKEKPVPYDAVKISYPIDLRLVAECVDVSASDLQELNPSLLRLTTPKDREFELHVPAGTANKFQSAVASIPVDKRVWWRYHKVQAGETLASIARTYRTEPKSIAQANGLDDLTLSPESRLIIPIAPGKQSDSTTYSRVITRYKIRKGDTVESVAENFGVSAKMIRTWNRLKGESLAGRKTLLVHLPVSPGARETRETRVASKRTSSKSSTHGLSTQRASADKSSSAKVTAAKTATSHHASATETESAAVVHHKVKQGETLYSIASSYNTTVSALKQSNRNIATLRPGMILVIRDVR